MANVVQLGNDTTLTLSTLTNAVTATVDNSATVTAQLYNAAGTAVGSAVTLTSLGSAGNYRGTLQSSVLDAAFSAGDPYRIKIVAVNGGSDGEFNLRGYVAERGLT